MRLLDRSTRFFLYGLLTFGASTLPAWSTGCSARSACFVFSQAEQQARNGCPAQAKALPFFTDPTCPGPVVSVDGEGIFTLNPDNPEQSLCCYPVTQHDLDPDALAGECIPPVSSGGFGGVGGFGSGGFGVSGTVGVGGVGGGACFNVCSPLLSGASPTQVCGGAADSWAALVNCACVPTNPCFKVCSLNICQVSPITKECFTCLDGATSTCGAEVDACQAS